MAAKGTIDFQAVFDSTPTPLMLMTVDLVIVEMNQAFAEAIGRSREAIVGLKLFEAFPSEGEGRRMLGDSLDRVRATGEPDALALLHYPIPVGDVVEDRYWSCTHLPVRDGDGAISFILQNSLDVTRLHRMKAAEGGAETPRSSVLGTVVLQRAERVQALNASLLQESAHLHNLFMQAPSFMCVLRGPNYQFELANSAFMALVGMRDIVGRPIREAIPEGVGQAYIDLLDTVYQSGEPFVGKQMKAEFERVPGAGLEETYLNFVYQPIFGSDGRVVGIFVDGNDVTDHVKAEKSQALLMRELHHRVRNTLATVQGVMNSTARTAETIEDYQWAFSGRISSLARTHSLLTEEIQQFVSFPNLLKQEVGIYSEGDTSRVVLEGPDVELPSQLAVPLGMTIHELTTNAFRHGALSTSEGRVTVTWTILPAKEKRILICRWTESGGPIVSPPVRHGFGSMILTRVLAQQIGAKVDAQYSAEGFALVAEIPLDIERV
ncbi:sensor histidine kinase [Beijerinckia sp. L45]|uniref:sensor histidine kinase n=1 Tax=Beijerinckia sp. L45 TaxID=1641855 RepID=UPI00131DAEC7|nr:PAS domain-containing protein [Beijerinckia sp. L45]